MIKKKAQVMRSMQTKRGSKFLSPEEIQAVFNLKNKFGRKQGDKKLKKMRKALEKLNRKEADINKS